MKKSYKNQNSYLSDEEIYNLEVSIYNDDNESLYKALPSINSKDDTETPAFKFVTKGKRWTFIEDTGYIVTEDGLVYHSRHLRRIKIVFSPVNLYVIIRRKSYYLEDIFLQQGWDFNLIDIVKMYKSKNYEMYVNKRYKEIFSTI